MPAIATAPPPSLTCPDWCTHGTAEYPCRGEHMAMSAGSNVPATGGHFDLTALALDEAVAPVVGAHLYWYEAGREGIEVSIQITQGERDMSASFKPSEALQFAIEFTSMLQAAVATGVKFGLVDTGSRVDELIALTTSIRSTLTAEVPR